MEDVLLCPKGLSVPDSVRVPVVKGFPSPVNTRVPVTEKSSLSDAVSLLVAGGTCTSGEVTEPVAKGFSVPDSTTATAVSTLLCIVG